MSLGRLADALLKGKPYFGRALQARQGLVTRHSYFKPIILAQKKLGGTSTVRILEIGSWAGASAVSWAYGLAETKTAGSVLCVDPWEPYFDLNVDPDHIYSEMNDAAVDDSIFRLFQHNIAGWGAERISFMRGRSDDVLPTLEDKSFDIIFLDGSHSYGNVAFDIAQAVRLITDGGVICGDDLELQIDEVPAGEHRAALASGADWVRSTGRQVSYHPGVTQAVGEKFGPVSCWDGLWAVRCEAGQWRRVQLDLENLCLPPHLAAELSHDQADQAAAAQDQQVARVAETRAYNIVHIGTYFAAVAKSLGPVSLLDERLGERDIETAILTGSSLEDILARVNRVEAARQSPVQVAATAQYNITEIGGRFAAIAKSLGPIDLDQERVGQRRIGDLILVGETLEDAISQAEAVEKMSSHDLVEQVADTVNYNIVKAGDRFAAVAKSIGHAALFHERLGERDLHDLILAGASLREVIQRALVHEVVQHTDEPEFVAEQDLVEQVADTVNYNIVKAGDRFAAVAKSIGHAALFHERLGERDLRDLILAGTSLREVIQRALAYEVVQHTDEPEFVAETELYNIVKCGTKFAAVAKALGYAEIFKERLGDRDIDNIVLTGESLREVWARAIALEAVPEPVEPELVAETAQFNIIRFDQKLAAIDKSLGQIEIFRDRIGECELADLILTGPDVQDLINRAQSIEARRAPVPVRLIEETAKYNIVEAEGRYIAVAKSIGPVALFSEVIGLRDLGQSIIVKTDYDDLKQAIMPAPEDDIASPDLTPSPSRSRVVTISLIVPTRQRLEKLTRFVRSIIQNAADPAGIEIILVIDQDDKTYVDFAVPNARLTTVITPPGLTMGQLNMAGYDACTGDYIMLMNDDVVASTQNWDQIVLGVFRDHPDEVLLVHVNDKIFGSVLCTFPFVTRAFCELAGGICPPDYRRYRIDDHIYSVFSLLSVLGHNRIVYLENVVFEHFNTVTDEHGIVSYQPDPRIHEFDTALFDKSLEARKSLAIDLAETIQSYRLRNNRLRRAQILAPITDTVALRRPEFVRFDYENLAARQAARATVAVVTADLRSAHAKRCLEFIKLYTTNYDLVIIDNNRGPNFNHPREMNRLIETCRTNYLVLLDDDVFVEPGWLTGMLAAAGPGVGVVTPLHKSTDGKLSYAGIVMNPDNSGMHTHALAVYPDNFPIQTLCSAIMLIDIVKCGDLRVDESYAKYFLDIDFGLRVWEHGFSVVCTPHVGVTHVGGGTLAYGTELSSSLFEEQRRHFISEWVDTGRYDVLARSRAWRDISEIQIVLDLPRKISNILEGDVQRDAVAAVRDVDVLLGQTRDYPAIDHWMTEQIYRRLETHPPDFSADGTRGLAALAGQLDYPVALLERADGVKIYLWCGRYYEVPRHEAAFDRANARAGLYRSAARIEYLASEPVPEVMAPGRFQNDELANNGVATLNAAEPELCESGYKGFNFIRCGDIFAISQAAGEFQLDRARNCDYGVTFRGETIEQVRLQVDRLEPKLVEEGYNGFNLLQYDQFYALPQSEGAFDIGRAQAGLYNVVLQDIDLAQLRRKVDGVQPPELAAPAASQAITIAFDEAAAEPELCESGYKGFNFIRCGEIFAISQAAGEFQLDRARNCDYGVTFRGETIEQVRLQVDRLEPKLVEEGYNGFNLLQYDRFYALPQSDGAFDIGRAQAGLYNVVLQDIDLVQLRRKIDGVQPPELAAPAASQAITVAFDEAAEPVSLCEEGYKGFNLLRCGKDVFAISQSQGAFDIVRAKAGAYPVIFTGASVPEVKWRIDRLEPALLVEGYKGFNLVQFDRVYGVPQASGPFQIERALAGGYSELYEGVTLAAVKASIDLRPPAVGRVTRVKRLVKRLLRGKVLRVRPATHLNIAADSRRWLALNPVTLVVPNYKGWSIHRFEFKYFAIPQADGVFVYDSFVRGAYQRFAAGHSIIEVKQQLDRMAQPDASAGRSRLIVAAFGGAEAPDFVRSLAPASRDRILLAPDQDVGVGQDVSVVINTPDRWAYLRGLQNAAQASNKPYDVAILPWLSGADWQDNGPEQIAAQLAREIEIVTNSGERRHYRGENLHRLIYNKAYLSSMLEVVPLMPDMKLLEVGCSDGLVCDMLRLRGARDVTGTDIMVSVGCGFLRQGLKFESRDAADLGFSDQSYDLVYSIATMEHLPKPFESFQEIIRVLRVGGYAYVQAGPLYYSPFGHHMFSYFGNLPWAHLRMSRDEIVKFLSAPEMSNDIFENFAIDVGTYVDQMLTRDHLNYHPLETYGIDSLLSDPRLEILKFNISKEGEDLLSDAILGEIQLRHPRITKPMLVQHGFEIAFRRVS